MAKKNAESAEENLKEENQAYSQEQFDYAWKDFALGIKREKKDSLFTTLMNCDKTIDSNHLITLTIHNSIQQTELDDCKGDFVRQLRQKLRNTNINLDYVISEKKSIKVMDSKATFDKLAEENSSLNKFRKLFNLDIEF
ncbi:MAG: thermostable 8-oxoguanine DNA glycosylase [Arenicella sp.]